MGHTCRLLEGSGILFGKKGDPNENLPKLSGRICSASLPEVGLDAAACKEGKAKCLIIKSLKSRPHQVKLPRTTSKGESCLRKPGWEF